MAKECGWDFKFIGGNFTLSQIKKYFETISNFKREDLKNLSIAIANSAAFGAGNLKADKFEDYLYSLESFLVKDPEESLRVGIDEGLIEEK